MYACLPQPPERAHQVVASLYIHTYTVVRGLICMYACMHTYTYISTRIHMYVCMYAYIYIQ
jgi:hypothetical protein